MKTVRAAVAGRAPREEAEAAFNVVGRLSSLTSSSRWASRLRSSVVSPGRRADDFSRCRTHCRSVSRLRFDLSAIEQIAFLCEGIRARGQAAADRSQHLSRSQKATDLQTRVRDEHLSSRSCG